MFQSIIDLLGEPIRLPAAVSTFRGSVAVKRPLLESLFNIIAVARGHAEEQEPVIAAWFDTPEGAKSAFNDPEKKRMIWAAAAQRTLMTDSASALLLIVAAEYDRFHRSAQVSVLDRGAASYITGIPVARAIHTLANQYKHLGKWRVIPTEGAKERPIIAALVDDPLREDAAAEFLRRAFTSYDDLEAAILSCADGLVTDGTIPSIGRAGISIITMQPGSESSG